MSNETEYCKLRQTTSSSPLFHDRSPVYYTLMHMDILLNARHFTLCTTFTVLAVGPKWSRSVMWHDRKNTNRCGEVFGSLRSRFGVVLRSAGTFSIYCPTGQLMQGECFYSIFNGRSRKQICFLHWHYIWIYLLIYSVLAHPLPRSTTGRHKLLFIRPNVYAYYTLCTSWTNNCLLVSRNAFFMWSCWKFNLPFQPQHRNIILEWFQVVVFRFGCTKKYYCIHKSAKAIHSFYVLGGLGSYMCLVLTVWASVNLYCVKETDSCFLKPFLIRHEL